MLPDPNLPLRPEEKLVFGADAQRHPVTGYPLETGNGAAPVDRQVLGHIDMIEAQEGEAVADGYRRKLGVPTRADIAAQQAAQAAHEDRVKRALALLDAAEGLEGKAA